MGSLVENTERLSINILFFFLQHPVALISQVESIFNYEDITSSQCKAAFFAVNQFSNEATYFIVEQAIFSIILKAIVPC